jgi:hypothetical protein
LYFLSVYVVNCKNNPVALKNLKFEGVEHQAKSLNLVAKRNGEIWKHYKVQFWGWKSTMQKDQYIS